MRRHLPYPPHPDPCTFRIRLTRPNVDLPRDGLVYDGLLLLFEQRNQLLLGADVALDSEVYVVEEAGDGGLFGSDGGRGITTPFR